MYMYIQKYENQIYFYLLTLILPFDMEIIWGNSIVVANLYMNLVHKTLKVQCMS